MSDDDPTTAPDRAAVEWPVELRGVTESIVATLGPNDRWNLAALGLHAPGGDRGADSVDDGGGDSSDDSRCDHDDAGRKSPLVTARTWGNTRTRRNFRREGGGVVQFGRDPELFVDAALTVTEREEPVHPNSDAWVEVAVERIDAGRSGGTRWEEWSLSPVEAGVRRRVVPTTNRGYSAVVEATVAASRLGVDAYDTSDLLDRLEYLAEVVRTCGGPPEYRAFARVVELADLREYEGFEAGGVSDELEEHADSGARPEDRAHDV